MDFMGWTDAVFEVVNSPLHLLSVYDPFPPAWWISISTNNINMITWCKASKNCLGKIQNKLWKQGWRKNEWEWKNPWNSTVWHSRAHLDNPSNSQLATTVPSVHTSHWLSHKFIAHIAITIPSIHSYYSSVSPHWLSHQFIANIGCELMV